MARLFILLFASLISFIAYSSNKVPAGYHDGSTNHYINTCNYFTYSSGMKQLHSKSPNFEHSQLQGQICYNLPNTDSDIYKSSFSSGMSGTGPMYYCPPDGNSTHVVGPDSNNMCTDPNAPEPEPHSCPDSGTFITTTWGRDGLSGWSTCRSDNCVAAAQRSKTGVCYRPSDDAPMKCEYDLFYTGQACSYDPDNGGVNPPDHVYPDEPVTPPDPEQPPSPDLPDGGGDGVEPPIYDPDGEGDGKPDDPVQPPNPDPTPDPDDPNLSDGENAVVGELSEANQRLENIDHTLQELTNTTKADNDSLIAYQTHLLGEMKTMNQTLLEGIGGGGGGAGNGITDGLDDIACLLDETCEGGGSKSSVTENQCKAFECDGDAVVCYIARKEWAKNCDVENFLDEGGAGDEFATGIQQLIDDNPIENIDAGTFNVDSVMNKYTGGNGFQVNEGCPAPRNVDMSIASMTIDYQPFCDLASIINWFLISFALVGSALLIAKYGL